MDTPKWVDAYDAAIFLENEYVALEKYILAIGELSEYPKLIAAAKTVRQYLRELNIDSR